MATAKIADRYTLLSMLGSGGMASVYRATDDSLRRTIALKRLTRADAVAPAHFEAEFRALAGLRHPSIIEIAHQDFDANKVGRVRLGLARVNSWRRCCSMLARSFDGIVGSTPW
jgi:serine/threonine protein kinase